jgi:DNA-binding SARP family transcriptional activator
MLGWKVIMFGKFNIDRNGKRMLGIETHRVQELFSFLLLFRDHQHSREQLAETLWGDLPAGKSRKCLRQALWRLQLALKSVKNLSEPELLIDNNWIQLKIPADLWMDTVEFEKVFALISRKKIQECSTSDFEVMQAAADLYQGDLLDGWYNDWCTFERERFQVMHLILLDKMVQFCELHQLYELGLIYGMEVLHHDHAYERAHRQLMRLYFLTGNRTQALHQYEHCTRALREELDVEPSGKTKQLYEQIKLDQFNPGSFVDAAISTDGDSPTLREALYHLEEVSKILKSLAHRGQSGMTPIDADFSEPV